MTTAQQGRPRFLRRPTQTMAVVIGADMAYAIAEYAKVRNFSQSDAVRDLIRRGLNHCEDKDENE